ncbi:helix-turn-helix domain-containing protein [Alcanivorax sp. VBW004]|uniref:helix-turn-helix domain-containing protein n=1 Tax=Alcanivorax sp. VBW004 TaxID=1287708 RepID=UPI0018AD0FC9|nr:helix-turn-helix domain-containing protein [Alcanivorax sp. VBW004]
MKWSQLGRFLSEARSQAGIAQQSDLAARVGVSQQTISRWEKGTSRPRSKQVPTLASVLKCDAKRILELAGYTEKSPVTISFDKPWPLDALSEESFERFCTDLLKRLHRAAKIYRYGDKGHTQEGLDVEVIFEDDTCHTYQCKRHAQFGPQKIKRAVEAHTRASERKYILVSCLASPQAREEIKNHANWELWDREDISRHIRLSLSKEEQRILVDVYFPGQRKALIGELEPSPWQEPNKFFSSMTLKHSGFSHLWNLVGREKELKALTNYLKQNDHPITLLSGSGGSGKTRLIKAAIDIITSSQNAPSVFLLTQDRLTLKSLEELGREKKILVCDDAHDREELRLLIEYAANPDNNTRLLLAYRKYGEMLIRKQAPQLITDKTPIIILNKLSPKDAENLATQALSEFGAKTAHGKKLAQYTGDCPLATIIGAQVLSAKKEALPEFLHSEEIFRDTLMLQLVEKIVEGVGSGFDPDSVRQVLEFIALMQPIYENDSAIIQAIEETSALSKSNVIRIIKRLRNAGVLFRRGRKSKISPDLLGDFLVESSCVIDSGSTGVAEKVFESLPPGYIGNFLVNLGRLDWRLSNGNTRQSKLLDSIWEKLDTSEPYCTAVSETAFYQPEKSLRYAKRLIESDSRKEHIAKILKYTAYNFDYLPDVCELLWKIGRDDDRPLNQHPWHGIRILNELGGPEPGKPVCYCDMIADFAISLLNHKENWKHTYSPIDFLGEILSTEGHTTVSSARSLTMTPFCVPQEIMAETRRKVINALISLLSHEDKSIGYKAALKLHEGLRYPMGLFGAKLPEKARSNWTTDFIETLRSINNHLMNNNISAPVLMGVVKSISWHAFYADETTSTLALEIFNNLDRDLKTKTIRLIMDGWGHSTFRHNIDKSWESMKTEKENITIKILESFNDEISALNFIKECIAEIEESNPDRYSSSPLIDSLLDRSPKSALEILHCAILKNDKTLLPHAGKSISTLLYTDATEAHKWIDTIFHIGEESKLSAIEEAYAIYAPGDEYSEEDIAKINKIFSHDSLGFTYTKSSIIRRVAKTDKNLAMTLIMKVKMSNPNQSVHELFLIAADAEIFPIDTMSEEFIDHLISLLKPIPAIDDYWVQEFLKKTIGKYPKKVITLFTSRIESAVEAEDWHTHPVPHGPYRSTEFNLLSHQDGHHLLDRILDWALPQIQDYSFSYRFGELMEALFHPFDENLAGALRRWAENGDHERIHVLSAAIREAQNDFVFEQKEFVAWALSHAQSYGEDFTIDLSSTMYGTAISGIRSGTVGKPFQQDIDLAHRSEAIIKETPIFHPAYKLYTALLEHAQDEIERQKDEGKFLDEEDEE